NDAKPELIMMDVRMPRMTGYEACKAIKEIEEYKNIPIVFLTAKGQDEEVQNGIEVGAVAYIIKPFSPDELTRKIGDILSKASAEKQKSSDEKPPV
ncbi:MAG: response regulator, partial [Anaerolineae bacterium]|nr:response regulator [Anaerolineae bacterium]